MASLLPLTLSTPPLRNGTIYDDIERWIGEIWMLADPETYESLGPSARDTKQIQSILGKKDYSNVMDGLKESYDGDNLNNLVSTLLTENGKLKEDLNKSGIDDDEFYKYIESILDPQKHEIEQIYILPVGLQKICRPSLLNGNNHSKLIQS